MPLNQIFYKKLELLLYLLKRIRFLEDSRQLDKNKVIGTTMMP